LNEIGHNREVSDTVLEIVARLCPRRYRRFKDLRPYGEASEWARKLDWRNNPYDRFLLRREILHHLESFAFYEPKWNVYAFASREEIAAEVDRLIENFPPEREWLGIFNYVLVKLPWDLAYKHRRIRFSLLTKALHQMPTKPGERSFG
jgi:hypothetical protein